MVAGRQRRELCEEQRFAEVGSRDREDVAGVAHSRMSRAAKRYERSRAVPGSTVNVIERTFDRKSSSGVGEGV
jgi:hypothetical protein